MEIPASTAPSSTTSSILSGTPTAVISLLVFVVALSVAAQPVQAQAPVPQPTAARPVPSAPDVVVRDEAGRVAVRATRITRPLRIDGRLDDTVYSDVRSVAGFVQQEPREGEPASENTEVWLLFDADNLYVSARCWDGDMAHGVANDMRRDSQNLTQHDNLSVILDTFHDGRSGVLFLVTAIGGMADGLVTDEREYNGDWNTVWNARVARYDWGWSTELVIPFKSLRYNPGADQIWGLNVRRTVRRRNEWTYLTRVPASYGINGIYKVSTAATMVGLEVPSSGKNLEVKPYAIAGVRTDRASSPPVENHLDRNWGVDAKAGLTRNLTANLTYHTDFAQVEADEQQINLTRFNLLFPEKREFFLEGQGIFGFGGGQGMFGSGGDVPMLFFSRRIGLESGRPVPIEAGARLTGRVGKYSVGALHTATGDDPLLQARATNFSVVRLRRDVLRRSAIGLIASGRSRSSVSSGSNAAYGVDGVFSFFDNLNVNTYLARTQTSGMHARDVSYRTQLDYNADRYGLQLERLAVGEHFNPEVGFLRRENFKQNYVQARFSPRPSRNGPFRAVRRFSWSGHYEYTTNGDNRLETRELELGPLVTQFQSSDSIGIAFTRSYELVERPFSIARGATILPGIYEYFNVRNMNTLGQHRRISGTIEFQRGSLYNGHRTTLGFRNGRMKITPRLAVEPGVSVNWIDLPAGNVTAKLVSTRATYTASPRMFVAALVQYNSTTASLSTNVRLRWEYQPGSEIFVVYTEGRDTLARGAPELQNRGLVVKANRLVRF